MANNELSGMTLTPLPCNELTIQMEFAGAWKINIRVEPYNGKCLGFSNQQEVVVKKDSQTFSSSEAIQHVTSFFSGSTLIL